MTGADFTGVDIDLLADYIGGALDDTPDAARVAALIVDDPAWRDAHALLSDAMAGIGDSLNALGTVPEPMPADVAARLDAVLAEPTFVDAATPVPGRHLSAVPDSGVDRDPARRPRSWRRSLRWGSPIAAAAIVLAVAGVGLSYLGAGTSSSDSAASSAGSGLTAQAEGAPSLPGSVAITSTGTDYSPSSLAEQAQVPLRAPDTKQPIPRSTTRKDATPSGAAMSDNSLADPLARLRAQDALQFCLAAIDAENADGPITVQSIDYARFSGAPALIVRFTDGNGTWAWASGTDCGLAGVGADRRYKVKVG